MMVKPEQFEKARRVPGTCRSGATVTEWGTAALAGVLTAALGLRLYLVLVLDFPINDGALFYEFVRALAVSFPALPPTVSFNGLDIPFAYPPLAFWTAALLTKLGFDPLGVTRVMPITMNGLYLILIALLLVRNGYSRLFTALVLIFFCLRLRSFEWLVMGGGLSRGMGSVFFISTLLVVRVPTQKQMTALPLWRLVLGGACVGGAILSHLEWGLLAAATLVVSRGFGAKSFRSFVVEISVAGVTALLAISPWLLVTYEMHGFAPFLSASGTSDWGVRSAINGVATIGQATIANPFILFGLILTVRRRDCFWAAFAALCIFLTPRHGATPLMLPLAIFAAQGAVSASAVAERLLLSRRLGIAAVSLAAAALVSVNGYRDYMGFRGVFRPLPVGARQVMASVSEAGLRGRFAMINPIPWQYDASGEWFPTLSGSTSVTTVQGREWLPGADFQIAENASKALKRAGSCNRLFAALKRFGQVDFIWAERAQQCFHGPRYKRILEGAGVTIFSVGPESVGA